MLESRHDQIVKFVEKLPSLRLQVSDGPLLDQCQADLNDLLELSKGVTLEPDPAPVNVDVPYASGIGSVGSLLNCTMGNWQYMEMPGSTYAYQWESDGKAITGATAANYVVVVGDRGNSLTCIVTATNPAGATAAPPSNAIAIS